MTHTETARELLWRHQLPEDIIDGVLALHAQELSAVQRKAHDERRPYFHMGLPCTPGFGCHVAELIALIVPGVPEEPSGPAAATGQTAPAVSIDGHPQLEAIAAAVHEHCQTGDGGIVHDDPRNIAVAALAAVLPASVDRADVLDQAAAIVFALDFDELRATTQFDSHRQAWELGTIDAANKLRRVAAENPGTTQTPVCVDDRTPVQCTASVLRKPHGPHGWEPQPGMDPVPCDGYPQPKEA